MCSSDLLGQGGMGAVWMAWDRKLERPVALKFVRADSDLGFRGLHDLKKETQKCLTVTHPGIVRIYDYIEDEELKLAAISMEYVDGYSLKTLQAAQPHGVFEPHQLMEYLKDLCDALDYAHKRARMVHRDLKPANLMVTGNGELKIMDFGISSYFDMGGASPDDSKSKEKAVRGTIAFMSPQQMVGKPPHPADDIYSIGATLYFLIAGTPPFYKGEVWYQVIHELAPPMALRRREEGILGEPIPQEWEMVVSSCLAKDPANRPADGAEIIHRLGLLHAIREKQDKRVHLKPAGGPKPAQIKPLPDEAPARIPPGAGKSPSWIPKPPGPEDALPRDDDDDEKTRRFSFWPARQRGYGGGAFALRRTAQVLFSKALTLVYLLVCLAIAFVFGFAVLDRTSLLNVSCALFIFFPVTGVYYASRRLITLPSYRSLEDSHLAEMSFHYCIVSVGIVLGLALLSAFGDSIIKQFPVVGEAIRLIQLKLQQMGILLLKNSLGG